MVSFIAFFVTHKISIAATIASIELVTETFIFYLHEKFWNFFQHNRSLNN